jgi:hypothetical protein
MVRPEERPGLTIARSSPTLNFTITCLDGLDRLDVYTTTYLTQTDGLNALILEMEPTPGATSPHQFLEAPVLNGWEIIETSFILLNSDQIGSLNSGTGNNYIRSLPSVFYFVDFRDTAATAYVKFWMQDKFTFAFVYEYRKNFGKWFLTSERKL